MLRFCILYLSSMKSNLLIKGITLCGFAVLMTGFVAYKAGAFEGHLTDAIPSVDSPGQDSINRRLEMMAPSSKSAPIFEPRTTEKKDSPVQQQNNANAPQQQQQQQQQPKVKTYMGGSKSGGVFTPQPDDTSQPK